MRLPMIKQSRTETDHGLHFDAQSTRALADQLDDLTRSYIRLANLPACPLDRLRATLWRQACQLLFTLRFLNRGTRRTDIRFRGGRAQNLAAATAVQATVSGCFQSQVLGIGPQIGFPFPVGDMQGYRLHAWF